MKKDFETRDLEHAISSQKRNVVAITESKEILVKALAEFKDEFQKRINDKTLKIADGKTMIKIAWGEYVTVRVVKQIVTHVIPLHVIDIDRLLVDVETEGEDDV